MKVRFLPVIVIGLALSIMVLAYGYIDHYQPNIQDAQQTEKYADDLKAEGDKEPQALKRKAAAKVELERVYAQWRAIVAVKTPPPNLKAGGINLGVPPQQLISDARTYRDSLQLAINKQMRVGGVSLANGPEVPIPPDDSNGALATLFNYPTITFPVVIQELGTITVRGTYAQIMNHVRSWKSMPRYLAMADGLTLAGTSPILTATYRLTIVGYIRSSDVWPLPPTTSFISSDVITPAAVTTKTPVPPTAKGSGAPKAASKGPAVTPKGVPEPKVNPGPPTGGPRKGGASAPGGGNGGKS